MPRRSSRTPGWSFGEPLDVQLVDHRVVQRRPGRAVVLPVERRVDHDALRDRGGVVLGSAVAVLGAGRVRERARGIPVDRALDRLRVRVDQQLRRVEAVPVGRARTGRGRGSRSAGRARLPAGSRASRGRCAASARACSSRPSVAEQAELDTLGMLGEEREVRSLTVPRRTERERTTGPDAYWPSGTSQSTESGGSVSSAENGWPCHGSSSAVMLSFRPGAPAGVALDVGVQELAPRAPAREADAVAGAVRVGEVAHADEHPASVCREAREGERRSPRRRPPRASGSPDGSKSRSQSAGSAR